MIAAVTGATGAIGAEICRRMTATCDHVVGLYHSRDDRAHELEREIGVGKFRSIRCDLINPDDIRRAYQELRDLAGPPSAIVLAAGSTLRGSVMTARSDLIRPLFELNVAAQIEFARLSLKEMVKARHGRIVMIGSRAGLFGSPGQAAYAASKAALTAWVVSAAGEIGQFGITVNAVAPGAMESAGDDIYTNGERNMIVERIAARRLGTPQDVAAAVMFLLSAEAAYINGVTLPVDGGARF